MKPTTIPRSLTGAAAIASAALLIQALIWFLIPDLNPYDDANLALLRGVLALPAYTWLLAALALIGTIVAGIATLRPGNPSTGRLVGVVSPILLVALFAATTTLSALSFAGYLVALALPAVAIVTGIVAAVRVRRARIPLVAVLVVAITALVVLHDQVGRAVATAFGGVTDRLMDMWAIVLTLTATALWGALTAQSARTSGAVQTFTTWLVRHRRPITVLAALGPMPYALVRVSWLTPWPFGAPTDADPAILTWGFLLSLGAWMGAILTIGLIRPWGERLPRWMPRIGGRTVPPSAAIVPGSVVAGLLCLAAVPLTLMFIGGPGVGLIYFFLLPVWYWGPMLALAVWAYAGHRAGTSPSLPGATALRRSSPDGVAVSAP